MLVFLGGLLVAQIGSLWEKCYTGYNVIFSPGLNYLGRKLLKE